VSVSVAFVVGRFLLVVPVVLLGTSDALDAEATPGARLVAAAGVLAAAGVVLGVWGDLAALVLAAQVLLVGLAPRPGVPQTEALLTAIGLAGGALVVFAVYAGVGEALNLTITDPVITLDLR
jgi:putative oxidoreductase